MKQTNKTTNQTKPSKIKQTDKPRNKCLPGSKAKMVKSWVPYFEIQKMSSACPNPEGPRTP